VAEVTEFPEFVYRLRLRWYQEWDAGDHALLRLTYRDDALGKDLVIETRVHYSYLHLATAFECARTYMLRKITDVGEAYKEKDYGDVRRRPARV